MALNNLGDAAGSVWSSDVNAAQPAVWRNGQLTMLSTLDMPNGNALAMNDQGVVVGSISDQAHPAQIQPVMWNGNQGTVLGDFPGAQAWAAGINSQGQVLIVSASSTETQTWVWQSGALTPITSPGAGVLGGSGINNLGHVAGTGEQNNQAIAFFWDGQTTTVLPNLAGDVEGYVRAINDSDQIVGSGLDSAYDTHAILWQNGQAFNLNDLIPAESGAYLLDATAIADNGTIVANGYFNGAPASFLLTPSASPSGSNSVPEPASAATLGVAGLLLLRRRRRGV